MVDCMPSRRVVSSSDELIRIPCGVYSMAEPAYRIGVEEQDLVVRVRRGVLDRDEVSRFLDFLELESIRRRSELTEAEAARLAEEIDASVWERYRFRVEG